MSRSLSRFNTTPDIQTIIERNRDAWNALLAEHRESWDGALDCDAKEKLEEAVDAFLFDTEGQRLFHRYIDGSNLAALGMRDAAFALGLRIGARLRSAS